MTDELLVHISAPTTRQGDELYQSLAEAYLEFEPQSPQQSSSRQVHVSNQPALLRLDNATAPDQGNSFQGTTDTSVLSASRDSYGSFPSYPSFDGPKTPTPAVSRWADDIVEDGLPPTSSQVSESEDMHNQGRGRRSLRSRPVKKIQPEKRYDDSSDVDMGFIEATQVAATDHQSQSPDHFLMEPGGASENDTNEDQARDGITGDLIPVMPHTKDSVPQRRRSTRLKAASSVEETPVSTRSSAFTARLERTGPGSNLSPFSLSKNTRDEEQDIEESLQSTKPLDFSKLETSVYPPQPEVSIAQPGTLPSQITPSLAALKKQNPTRFQPIKILKKPKPDDRGYWLVSCSRWNRNFQQVFWNNICTQVSNGHLGWGVTLHREYGTSISLGRVKLYCWGEVVEHTWLVLWMCSQGKINNSGVKWINADGNAAFVMS